MNNKKECRKICAKLNAYLENELKPVKSAIITQHLQKCAQCKEEYTALKNLTERLSEYPEVEMPNYLTAKLLQIPAQSKERSFWSKIGAKLIPVPVAAAILFSLFAALFVGQNLIQTQDENGFASEYQLAQETFYHFWEDITNE